MNKDEIVPLEEEFKYYTEQDFRDADENQMLNFIKSKGWPVFYYAKSMHDKKDIVMKAVKIDGMCLKWASKELRDDKEVALEALKQNWEAIMDVSLNLRGDKQFILEAIEINPKIYYFAINDLQNDTEVIDATKKIEDELKNVVQPLDPMFKDMMKNENVTTSDEEYGRTR